MSRVDLVLDSEIIEMTSRTPRTKLERLHDRNMVDDSLQAWQALTKVLEKKQEMLKMALEIRSLSEAWRALTRIADESEEAAYDRAKQEFENLEIGVSESITECFARLHIILMKLEGHKIVTPAREIKRTVLGSLTSPFPNETRLYAMRGDFDLTDLEDGLVRAEEFQSD